MKHLASPAFWNAYERLPQRVRRQADARFALLKANPGHPSLHLKRTGRYWSVRIGPGWRALGTDVEGGILWFWIGSHADYDHLLK